MLNLYKYIRRLIYLLATLVASGFYYWSVVHFPTAAATYGYLGRTYGLTALWLFFVVLTPGLVKVYWPTFPGLKLAVEARQAIGVSLFYFVLAHLYFSFVYNLNGTWRSIFLMSSRNQLSLIVALVATVVLVVMAITSTDTMVRRLARWWKPIHRLIYPTAILVLIHVFLIGSHFSNTRASLPLAINVLALLFIFLEVGATAHYLVKTDSRRPEWLNSFNYFCLALILVAAYFAYNYVYTGQLHSHGTVNARQYYTLNTQAQPSTITPNQPVNLSFSVTDNQTGKKINTFTVHQEQLMHVMIVDSTLNYYAHLHPVYDGKETFRLTTTLPHEGSYRLYVQYSTPDLGEQLGIVDLKTTQARSILAQLKISPADQLFENQYQVRLSPSGTFQTKSGQDTVLAYEIKDKSGQPITDLEPYLGAFGHLAIVSEDGDTFIHVHPIELATSAAAHGGPTVHFRTTFTRKGKYKLFGQFQRQGKVFLTEFVIEVK